MKKIYVLALAFSALTQNAHAKVLRFECPSEIKTVQSAKEYPSDGWSGFRDTQSKNGLDTIGVFDGPPEELASLIPDNEDNQDLAKTSWTFNKNKARPIYVTCSYLKTDLLLTKALPLEITQCKVLLSKGNPPHVLGLVCK